MKFPIKELTIHNEIPNEQFLKYGSKWKAAQVNRLRRNPRPRPSKTPGILSFLPLYHINTWWPALKWDQMKTARVNQQL